jgi:hypothetical protein
MAISSRARTLGRSGVKGNCRPQGRALAPDCSRLYARSCRLVDANGSSATPLSRLITRGAWHLACISYLSVRWSFYSATLEVRDCGPHGRLDVAGDWWSSDRRG